MAETHWYRDSNGQELLIEEETAQHEYVLSQGARFTEIDGPEGQPVAAEPESEPKAKRSRKAAEPEAE